MVQRLVYMRVPYLFHTPARCVERKNVATC